MPKTKRNLLKRKLAQSYHYADECLYRLKDLHLTFAPVHPELAEGLEVAAQLVIQAQTIMETFSLAAWNTKKESLMTYRE